MNQPLTIMCGECGGYLIEYDREYLELDDDFLVKFRHESEQETDCDGYFQARLSRLSEPSDDSLREVYVLDK